MSSAILAYFILLVFGAGLAPPGVVGNEHLRCYACARFNFTKDDIYVNCIQPDWTLTAMTAYSSCRMSITENKDGTRTLMRAGSTDREMMMRPDDCYDFLDKDGQIEKQCLCHTSMCNDKFWEPIKSFFSCYDCTDTGGTICTQRKWCATRTCSTTYTPGTNGSASSLTRGCSAERREKSNICTKQGEKYSCMCTDDSCNSRTGPAIVDAAKPPPETHGAKTADANYLRLSAGSFALLLLVFDNFLCQLR